jgi:hypothetical protein
MHLPGVGFRRRNATAALDGPPPGAPTSWGAAGPWAATTPGPWGPPDGQPNGTPPSGAGLAPEVVDLRGRYDEEDEPGSRYPVRPARPAFQAASRIGLWTAVVIGCLGGLFAVLRPAQAEAPPVIATPSASSIPAPVAGMAQLVVEAWLTATPETQPEDLDHLFVEPPTLQSASSGGIAVEEVVPVAGQRMTDGYWRVTVAARVVETPDPRSIDPMTTSTTAGDGPVAGTEPTESVWYVEVGIVGDVTGGLSALTTPAVVPPPPSAPGGWRASAEPFGQPPTDDPLGSAVDGFLGALLAGDGDPSRYLAAGVEVEAADPPPFAAVDLTEMAVLETAEGKVRVLAHVMATTEGGARKYFGYELMLSRRVDRWEVTQFSGAPTLVIEPPATDGGQGDAPAGGG